MLLPSVSAAIDSLLCSSAPFGGSIDGVFDLVNAILDRN
jgi:hypothetical protein